MPDRQKLDLIPQKRLRQILGDCSDMHLWRLRHAKEYERLKFPEPIIINRRNFWRQSDVEKWIARQAGKVAA